MINNKRILKTGVLAAAMTIVFAIFAFRASEWTNSVSSEFLVYGAAGNTGSGTTPPPPGGGGTTGGGSTTTKVVAQIASGAYDAPTHYGTIIEIINPNTSAITVSGNFYNDDGSPSTLNYATNLSSQPTFNGSFSNVNLPAGSILVISTGTSPATTPSVGTTNWGKITGSNTISVASFFELRHKGDEALYSRVGIPSSRPDMTSLVIPRVREKQADGSGLAEIETGFAIVNTGTLPATVTAKIIDANGNIVAVMSFVLKPNAHKVGIVNSAFAIQGEGTGRQYHYVMFSSDQPTIGAAALAFEGGSLTSFPVDPL
jgi:hypothetical protein